MGWAAQYYIVWIAALPLVIRDDLWRDYPIFSYFGGGGKSPQPSLKKRGIN
ncbi:MAG: hypothetical protein ACI8PD_000281 [Nitrospinales bacterium]|jgi:hypothetical protein